VSSLLYQPGQSADTLITSVIVYLSPLTNGDKFYSLLVVIVKYTRIVHFAQIHFLQGLDIHLFSHTNSCGNAIQLFEDVKMQHFLLKIA